MSSLVKLSLSLFPSSQKNCPTVSYTGQPGLALEIPNPRICEEHCQPWLRLNPIKKWRDSLARSIRMLKERRMWLPLPSFPWHKDFPIIQHILRMENGAGPPACWLCSGAATSLQASAFPNTALRSHKVFLIPPQWPQGYKCCHGTFLALEGAPCSHKS